MIRVNTLELIKEIYQKQRIEENVKAKQFIISERFKKIKGISLKLEVNA